MRIIKSVNDNQADLIADILELHCKGVIDADVTYGKGAMWKNTGLDPQIKFDVAPRTLGPGPLLKYDIKPVRGHGVMAADCRNLPLPDRTLRSIMFDPPFISKTEKARGKGSMIYERKYGIFPSHAALLTFCRESMLEFHRVLKTYGKVIFKNQDYVDGRRQHWAHCEIYDIARSAGFKAADLFILTAKSRAVSGRMKTQNTARKYHCYFWVFQKARKAKAC
jgi:hypothetical protein